jgi:hypothetical protein
MERLTSLLLLHLAVVATGRHTQWSVVETAVGDIGTLPCRMIHSRSVKPAVGDAGSLPRRMVDNRGVRWRCCRSPQ